jgi:hypothetical protein
MGRPSGKAVAARAQDAQFIVSGMDGCLHGSSDLFSESLILKDSGRIQQWAIPKELSKPILPVSSTKHATYED